MTLTKEWLQKTITELEEERDAIPGAVNENAAMALSAMKLALTSLEAEPVGEVVLGEYDDCGCHPDARVACIAADGQADWENFKDGTRLYTAPPSPVVPDAIPKLKDGQRFKYVKDGIRYSVNYANGWNQCRAAMLQGAEPVIQRDELPGTQIKQVADLYSIAVPGGRSVTYSTDAAEASDCRARGWAVEEFVKLERYQDAISCNSPAHYDLRPEQNNRSPAQTPIDHGYRPDCECFGCRGLAAICSDLNGNSPVITGCWCHACRPVTMTDMRLVVCPTCGNKRCPHANDHRNACTGSNELGQDGSQHPAVP